ncbi:MAG: carboxymuconolactone decarboxylase family protein [Acidimicrobiales bacterium]
MSFAAPNQRASLPRDASEVYASMLALGAAAGASLPDDLVELVKLRASILNGCAYCIELHRSAAADLGFDAATIAAVAAWVESPRFSDEQRVALAATDALTRLTGDGQGLPDPEWEGAVDAFGREGAVDLIAVIATINAWNRLAIATHTGAD